VAAPARDAPFARDGAGRRYHALVTMQGTSAAQAAADFRRARRRADLRELLAALGAKQRPLLSFDDVRRRLRAVESPAQYLEDVPLDAIVGSVGRTVDFTREFLPRTDSDRARWVGVKVAMTGLEGTPPVDLYRIGDAYFVRDGNHRVSVARQLGAKFVQAYVTPVHSRVPLSADASPDELIIAEEHARFLERTALDEQRRGTDLRVTAAGSYDRLLDHIEVHRYFMGIDEDREVGYDEAVAHWYDAVYLPVVERIRDTDLLRGFPGRTETDLYLWLSEHRGRLAEELGFALPSESIADAVGTGAAPYPPARQDEVLASAAERAGGRAGGGSLIDDVLVVLTDDALGEVAMAQALGIARLEGARVYGLHLVADEAARGSEAVEASRARFDLACREAGAASQFTVAVGPMAQAVLARAQWFDLVVVPIREPPPSPDTDASARSAARRARRQVDRDGATARLVTGYATLLRRSPRPVLAVTTTGRGFGRALVGYDGGTRSQAALFAGAYLAARHGTSLVVLTVADLARTAAATLAEARAYLERFGLTADYVERSGPVAEAIVATAAERDCDLILIGSYRTTPWLESMLGGVLEPVLRTAEVPVLVT